PISSNHSLLGHSRDAKLDGVVLDLRNNGGGSLDEAIELTGLFIEQGPVVQVRQTGGRVTGYSEPISPLIAV
ncbi:S41 family peptidase, partial [Klebsiella pneumoniae]